MRSYCGLTDVLTCDRGVVGRVVEDLQRDLRALGYYDGEISGVWAASLDSAIRAVRYDLTHPDLAIGASAYNRGRLVAPSPITGEAGVEPALADCIAVMSDDANFLKLPRSDNAAIDNLRAWEQVKSARDGATPTPFVVAILAHLAGGRHFQTPTATNRDGFITVRLDRDDPAANARITSRGYGIGRYTLSHHPPTKGEINGGLFDPASAAGLAFARLRDVFSHRVISTDESVRAADRFAERPLSPLRTCKYARLDPRFLADCQSCAAAAGKMAVAPGQPVYPGAVLNWAATPTYAFASYAGVPDRSDFPCDWPYAARRFDGDDIDSYHFQAHVLSNLLAPT